MSNENRTSQAVDHLLAAMDTAASIFGEDYEDSVGNQMTAIFQKYKRMEWALTQCKGINENREEPSDFEYIVIDEALAFDPLLAVSSS